MNLRDTAVDLARQFCLNHQPSSSSSLHHNQPFATSSLSTTGEHRQREKMPNAMTARTTMPFSHDHHHHLVSSGSRRSEVTASFFGLNGSTHTNLVGQSASSAAATGNPRRRPPEAPTGNPNASTSEGGHHEGPRNVGDYDDPIRALREQIERMRHGATSSSSLTAAAGRPAVNTSVGPSSVSSPYGQPQSIRRRELVNPIRHEHRDASALFQTDGMVRGQHHGTMGSYLAERGMHQNTSGATGSSPPPPRSRFLEPQASEEDVGPLDLSPLSPPQHLSERRAVSDDDWHATQREQRQEPPHVQSNRVVPVPTPRYSNPAENNNTNNNATHSQYSRSSSSAVTAQHPHHNDPTSDEARHQPPLGGGDKVLHAVMSRINEIEGRVTSHQGNFVRRTAMSSLEVDKVRRSVDHAEFCLAELRADVDTRLAALEERCISRLSTQGKCWKDVYDQLRSHATVELRRIPYDISSNRGRSASPPSNSDSSKRPSSASFYPTFSVDDMQLQAEALMTSMAQYDTRSAMRLASLSMTLTEAQRRAREHIARIHDAATAQSRYSVILSQLHRSKVPVEARHTSGRDDDISIHVKGLSGDSNASGSFAQVGGSGGEDDAEEKSMISMRRVLSQFVLQVRSQLDELRRDRLAYEEHFMDRLASVLEQRRMNHGGGGDDGDGFGFGAGVTAL